jgi:hypothetical protein
MIERAKIACLKEKVKVSGKRAILDKKNKLN